MSAITSSTTAVAPTSTLLWGLKDELPPAFVAYREELKASVTSLFSPLNITIILAIATLVYFRTRSSADPTIPAAKPITFRTFTPRVLLPYNGQPSPQNPNASVYLSVKSKVYDVTPGKNFYGPGGPYENFAGRDATRGLACQSFDDGMLTKDLDGPLDDCADLDGEQMENLRGWEERFDEKYLVVGKLISFDKSRNPWR